MTGGLVPERINRIGAESPNFNSGFRLPRVVDFYTLALGSPRARKGV
jgi:hypothetical protein